MSETKRRRVIAGNWKMYKNQKQTRAFFRAFKPLVIEITDCDIVIAPPFTDIPAAVKAAKGTTIGISSQDVFWEKEGAFTGQISTGMLVEAGCGYCIIGHSERRQFFGETNETVFKKTKAALAAGLMPIVCIGEMLADREAGNTEKVIEQQFQGSVGCVDPRRILSYPDSLRAGLGDWHWPHSYTGNCGRCAQVCSPVCGHAVFPEPCFRIADSLWRQRQA